MSEKSWVETQLEDPRVLRETFEATWKELQGVRAHLTAAQREAAEARGKALAEVQAMLVQDVPWEERARNVLTFVTEYLTSPALATAPAETQGRALCGKYLGDNDATCPQLTCIRDRGHAGDCDNVRGDHEPAQARAQAGEVEAENVRHIGAHGRAVSKLRGAFAAYQEWQDDAGDAATFADFAREEVAEWIALASRGPAGKR